MNEVSATIEARARKNYTQMLKALAERTQAAVALQLGCNESTVSRWKDGEFEKTARALAAMGLKVVPQDLECWPPNYIESLRTLAKLAVSAPPAQALSWDDPE